MDFDKVFNALKTHADTLVNEGTDEYGDIHTPMFCFQLDVKTHKPPHRDHNPMCVSFDASFQSRCANMDYENDNFRMLAKLTELTGDKTYADAADAYMAYFMEHCVSPTTKLFGWGEHIYYNLFTDDFNYRGHDGHEFEGYITDWDDLWRINPTAVKEEIEAIWEYHIHDQAGLNFDRHAHWGEGYNDGVGFLNHGMNYVYNFAFLHKVTGNPEYLDWAVRLANSRYEARDEKGMAPVCVVRNARGNHSLEYISSHVQCGTAHFLTCAYHESPHPRFIEIANDYCKAAFAFELEDELSKAQASETGEGCSDLSGVIEGMLNVYEATKDTWFLDKSRVAMAQTPKFLYKGGEDWGANEAYMIGFHIQAGLRLYKVTGEQQWLDIVTDKAQYALDHLFEGGLFKATSEGNYSDRYCARGNAVLGYGMALLAETLK